MEAVAQWQSACLWNKMLWVRAPPASPETFFRMKEGFLFEFNNQQPTAGHS